MNEYYPVCCWKCNKQLGWKQDYTYPMPSIYCEDCKCEEEESHET